jgi:hypothetical protein
MMEVDFHDPLIEKVIPFGVILLKFTYKLLQPDFDKKRGRGERIWDI